MQDKLRKLPALHHFLTDARVSQFGHDRVTWEARCLLDETRKGILDGADGISVMDLDVSLVVEDME